MVDIHKICRYDPIPALVIPEIINASGMQQHLCCACWSAVLCAEFAGGTHALLDMEGGAQERKFVGGSMQISEALASNLQQPVLLHAPVTRIIWHEKDDRGYPLAVVRTRAGTKHKARCIVLAIAPSLYVYDCWVNLLSPRGF